MLTKKMRFILSILIALMPLVSNAQSKATTTFARMRQQGEMIYYTVKSSKPFIYGNNKYYLHVGDKVYTRCQQSKEDGQRILSFYIPLSDYNDLPDNAAVYLTYGHVSRTDTDLDIFAKDDGVPCWSLGGFSHSSLNK